MPQDGNQGIRIPLFKTRKTTIRSQTGPIAKKRQQNRFEETPSKAGLKQGVINTGPGCFRKYHKSRMPAPGGLDIKMKGNKREPDLIYKTPLKQKEADFQRKG